MVSEFHASPLEEGLLIDMLVDGELEETERRELLLALDAQPDGWRRCALVFLEAQTWQEGLSVAAEPPEEKVTQSTRGATSRSRVLLSFLAIAASLLLVLSITGVRRDRDAPPQTSKTPPSKIASRQAVSAYLPEEQPVANANEILTLLVDDEAGFSRRLRVPLVQSRASEKQFAIRAAPAIPDRIRELFEELGHRVELQRRYAPIELQDGSRFVVPVDDLQIIPVHNPIY